MPTFINYKQAKVLMVLEEADKQKVADFLKDVETSLIFFKSDAPKCEFCGVIEELLNEIKEVSDVDFKVVGLNDPLAKKHGIEKAPAIIFEKYPNVQYFGIPSGHEFTPFLAIVKMASIGKVELPEAVQAKAIALDQDVNIKIFVTPTCPYCKDPVLIGHMLAMLNPKITSIMVEAMEYKELAAKHNVSAVPRIVINDSVIHEGNVSPDVMMQLIEKALSKKA